MSPFEENPKLTPRKIGAGDTLLMALKRMDAIDRKLLLVFDGDKFTGLLSIGDIQRAIIANRPLDTPVREVLRPNNRVAHPDDGFESIKQMMIQFRTECMPVIGEEGELTDVIFWEDIFPGGEKRVQRNLGLPVVIMAGGKGIRMKPFTNILPKPLLPIDEKTVVEHIMDRFLEIGCDKFFMSVNYKAEFIRYYFDTLANPAYSITYLQEEQPLGTAGSLYLLSDKIQSTFFVSNCDILIDQDYGAIADYHREQRNELTIVAALKHMKIPYGTIETAELGQLTALHEKPEITFKINSGLYILEPHLLREIPGNSFLNLTDLIEQIRKRGGRVGVFPVSENSWKDVGEWTAYLRTSKMLSHEDTSGW
jgi:dTDP-glucose pyrophosphorylase